MVFCERFNCCSALGSTLALLFLQHSCSATCNEGGPVTVDGTPSAVLGHGNSSSYVMVAKKCYTAVAFDDEEQHDVAKHAITQLQQQQQSILCICNARKLYDTAGVLRMKPAPFSSAYYLYDACFANDQIMPEGVKSLCTTAFKAAVNASGVVRLTPLSTETFGIQTSRDS
jgi:hypothetical protein